MRQLRQIHPHQLVEITCRISQGRYLLRPSDELNRHFLGVLGRAQRRESMKIHGVAVMSNHYHLLLSPRDGEHLARFMQYLQTNLSKEIKIVQKWDGPVWGGRYQSIAVADEDDAQIARLRYLLAQGVKEDLVERVSDWPGVHCARALLEGEPIRGAWYDRSRLFELNRRVRKPSDEEVAEPEAVALSPLPCWEGLPPEEIRERVRALVEAIERQAVERRETEGKRVVGVKRVRGVHPHYRPRELSRSPRPLFHATTRAAFEALREAYVEFVSQFRAAAKRLKNGIEAPGFPPGSFPPGLPFVPHAAPG
jgi:REP element-mobilizing transposase RayT